MDISEIDWQPRLRALVDYLVRGGDVRSEPWRAAFAQTPRHVFAPTVLTLSGSDATELSGTYPDQHQSWLEWVYSDDSLITAAGWRTAARPRRSHLGRCPTIPNPAASTGAR